MRSANSAAWSSRPATSSTPRSGRLCLMTTAAPEARADFWITSGYMLLDRDLAGRLIAGPDFIRAYLSRPEMLPPDEACDAERALHAALLDDPSRIVGAADLQRLADLDARENYAIFLRFRDYLVRAGGIEAA